MALKIKNISNYDEAEKEEANAFFYDASDLFLKPGPSQRIVEAEITLKNKETGLHSMYRTCRILVDADAEDFYAQGNTIFVKYKTRDERVWSVDVDYWKAGVEIEALVKKFKERLRGG